MNELRKVSRARRKLMDVLDDWPDVGELNPAFSEICHAASRLHKWLKEQDPQSLTPMAEDHQEK